MSAKGTVSRTGETKSAGVLGALTEAQAAKALGIKRRELLVRIRTGQLFSFWVRGRRYVTLPVF